MNLFDKIRLDPKYSMKASVDWFNKNVRAEALRRGFKAKDVLTDNLYQQTTTIKPGYMYSFFYDPKYKDELPYYDKFPLLLPFSKDKTHFTGLNLHYLMPGVRLKLLNKLMTYATNDNMDDTTKLKLSWRLLSNVSKYPEVRPCVKQYLISHVKSRFVKLDAKTWAMAVFLPTEMFNAQRATVWADSKRLSRKTT